MQKTPIFILKFVSKLKYAESLLKGELHVSKVKYFKSLGEDEYKRTGKDEVGCGDKGELQVSIENPSQNGIAIYLSPNSIMKECDKIDLTSFAINNNGYADTYIWCASIVCVGRGLIEKDGVITFDDNYINTMIGYSKYVVVLDPKQFCDVLCSSDIGIYDFMTVKYEVDQSKLLKDMIINKPEIVFTKRAKFKSQNECRLALWDLKGDTDHMKVQLCDTISKNSFIMETDKLLHASFIPVKDGTNKENYGYCTMHLNGKK